MSERGKGNGLGLRGGRGETPELARLRQRIDALDRKIVGLLNERAELGREVGREMPRSASRSAMLVWVSPPALTMAMSKSR